jgi:hypothetical protein
MKKLFVLIILLCSFVFIQAQTIEWYKCNLVKSKFVNDATGVWSAWEESKVDYFISVDTNEGIIQFDNAGNTKLTVRRLVSSEEKTDESTGEQCSVDYYSAFDEEGLKCTFVSFDYINTSRRVFGVVYINAQILWYCTIVKNSPGKQQFKNIAAIFN